MPTRGGSSAAVFVLLALLVAPSDVGAARALRAINGVSASGLGQTSSALPPPASNSAATGGGITGGQTSGFVPAATTGLTTTGATPAAATVPVAPVTAGQLPPAAPALPAANTTANTSARLFGPAPAPAPSTNFFGFIPTNQTVATTAPQATVAPGAAGGGQLITASTTAPYGSAGFVSTPTTPLGTTPGTATGLIGSGTTLGNPYIGNQIVYRG